MKASAARSTSTPWAEPYTLKLVAIASMKPPTLETCCAGMTTRMARIGSR